MPLPNPISRCGKILKYCLVIVLLVSSTSPALSASWQVNQAQRNASDDLILICTGSQFKWISSQAFYQTGKLVFVDPPASDQHSKHSLECSFTYINDKDSHYHHISPLGLLFTVYRAKSFRLLQRPYTAYPYRTGHSRAPPTLS
jgi:hypothetical protein